MNKKSGKGKALIIIIIILLLLILAGGGAFAYYYFTNANKPPVEIKLYEDYEEGVQLTDYTEFDNEDELTPLPAGLIEYKNEELGVRFGYPKDDKEDVEVIPVDETGENGLYISTIQYKKKSNVVQLRVSPIDVSQSDLDHIQKQREALVQELIKAGTHTVIEKVNGKDVEVEVVPTEAEISPITVSYHILDGQLGVKFSYKENDLNCTRIITIKDEKAYSITYKAKEEQYSYLEEENIANSFEFINKIDESKANELNTITLNGEKYSLPVKAKGFNGLTIDTKYASQKIGPNQFTIVSFYESEQPKYTAYIYNARACNNAIENGYVTAISTDINRGGSIVIYKGVQLGTSYADVKEALGSPATQYYSDDRTILTNIYKISGVTYELKLRNDDLSRPNDSAKVIAIQIRVGR